MKALKKIVSISQLLWMPILRFDVININFDISSKFYIKILFLTILLRENFLEKKKKKSIMFFNTHLYENNI